MKFYVLDGRINGQPIGEKRFISRADAEKRLERILVNRDLQIENDLFPSKHTEEFVCNQYTRFFISRKII